MRRLWKIYSKKKHSLAPRCARAIVAVSVALVSAVVIGNAYSAQDNNTKKDGTPSISPVAWHDVGRLAYKWTKGDRDTVVVRSIMETQTPEIVIEQDIAGPWYVECVRSVPEFALKVTVGELTGKGIVRQGNNVFECVRRGKEVRLTINGENIDPSTDRGKVLAQQVLSDLLVGKSGTLRFEDNGRIVGEPDGDPEFKQFMGPATSLGLFPLILPKDIAIRPGTVWNIEINVDQFDPDTLQRTKGEVARIRYRVVGLFAVDGVECVDVEVESKVELKGGSPIVMRGHAYFDHKAGRLAYTKLHGPSLFDTNQEISTSSTITTRRQVLVVPSKLPTADADNWKEFRSEAGRFSIRMPGIPREEKRLLDTPGGKVELSMFSLQVKDVTYFVIYSDIPEDATKGWTSAELLDSWRNGFGGNGEGKVRSEENILLNSHPGREVIVDKPDNETRKARAYLVKQRLYQILVVTSKGRESSEDATMFLDSFKLLTSEADS